MKKTVSLLLALSLFLLSSCRLPVAKPQATWAPDSPLPGYEALQAGEREAYRVLLEGLTSRKAAIGMKLSGEEPFQKVFTAVLYDNPGLLGVGRKGMLYTRRGRLVFQPNYLFSREEEAGRKERVEQKIREITAGVLREGMSPFEKELALHDWLLGHCRYDDAALLSGQEDEDVYSAFGALVLERAVCEGIAKAFALLLEAAGIPCTLVAGEAAQEGKWEKHMWNAVWLDGNAYYVDPTWNLNDAKPHRPFHTYFNITGDKLKKDHKIEAGGVTATAERENYYLRRGLCFSQYDGEAKAAIREAMEQDRSVELAFTSEDAFRFAMGRLVDEQEIYSLLDQARPGEGVERMKVYYNATQLTMQFSEEG